MTLADRRRLDLESVQVWPSFREQRLGEWILRFGGGVYGRSNSVQPFGDPGLALSEAVSACEIAYRAEALPPMFRLPHLGDWDPLDTFLAARGYEINDSALVQVCSRLKQFGGAEIELMESPSSAWLEAYFRSSGRGAGREAAVARLLDLLSPPRRFAAVMEGSAIASLGVGAIWNGTLWLFGIATRPEHRGRGHARQVCCSLMNWAADEGASRSALQVSSTNGAALKLYESLGFGTEYEYTYRRAAAR